MIDFFGIKSKRIAIALQHELEEQHNVAQERIKQLEQKVWELDGYRVKFEVMKLAVDDPGAIDAKIEEFKSERAKLKKQENTETINKKSYDKGYNEGRSSAMQAYSGGLQSQMLQNAARGQSNQVGMLDWIGIRR